MEKVGRGRKKREKSRKEQEVGLRRGEEGGSDERKDRNRKQGEGKEMRDRGGRK